MPLSDLATYLIAAAFTALAAWAAISDVRDRRIPNLCVLAVMALFVPHALLTGGWVSGLEAAGISLLVGYPLFHFNVMGAGDIKLFSAMSLLVGLQHLALFAVATTLIGGLMAVFSLASNPARALAMLARRGQADPGRGIPYGVAIASAATLIVLEAQFGLLPAEINGVTI